MIILYGLDLWAAVSPLLTPRWQQAMASVANLKFRSVSLRVRNRNFKFKAALELIFARAPLIPKFASEIAAIACALRNRSSSLKRLLKSKGGLH
jgi:hypothetical protein